MIKKILYSLSSLVFVTSFQIVALILTSHYAEPQEIGLITILISINSFLFLFVDFGLSNFLLHKKMLNFHSFLLLKNYHRYISMTLLLFAIMVSFFLSYTKMDEVFILSILMTGINSVAISLSRLDRAKLESEHRFKDINYADMLSRLIGLCLLSLLMYLQVNVVYSYLISLITINVIVKLIFIHVQAKRKFSFGQYYIDKAEIKKFCIPDATNSFMNFATQNMDLFIIASFAGMEVSGLYGILKIVATKPIQLYTTVLIKVYTPKIIEEKDASGSYVQLTSIISILSTITYSTLICIGPYILDVFFNIQDNKVHDAFLILCIYACLRSICIPVGILITKSGETKVGLYYTCFQLLISSICLVLFNEDLIVIVLFFVIYQSVILIPHWVFLLKRYLDFNFIKYHLLVLTPFVIPISLLNI